jgi:hypothetical protein
MLSCVSFDFFLSFACVLTSFYGLAPGRGLRDQFSGRGIGIGIGSGNCCGSNVHLSLCGCGDCRSRSRSLVVVVIVDDILVDVVGFRKSLILQNYYFLYKC